jgi:hypothetical protein
MTSDKLFDGLPEEKKKRAERKAEAILSGRNGFPDTA